MWEKSEYKYMYIQPAATESQTQTQNNPNNFFSPPSPPFAPPIAPAPAATEPFVGLENTQVRVVVAERLGEGRSLGAPPHEPGRHRYRHRFGLISVLALQLLSGWFAYW